jgi:6-phosphogluconolactonase
VQPLPQYNGRGELNGRGEIGTYPDSDRLAHAAAEHFVTLTAEAIAAHGQFVVALSGGSTPRAAYALLATEEFAARPSTESILSKAEGLRTGVDWSRVHIFWGDERCVPPDHPDSNYRMVRETLLDHIPLPARNVHRIRGEIKPEEAAADYERTLRSFFAQQPKRHCCATGEKETRVLPIPSVVSPSARLRTGAVEPRFDLVLLGMGQDGHTASLFPGTAALHEGARWVVAHYVDKLSAWRITLTPVVFNAAAHITFIVSGAGKAERLREVLAGPYQPDVLPAQIVRPTDGRLLWLVDAAAAAHLYRH